MSLAVNLLYALILPRLYFFSIWQDGWEIILERGSSCDRSTRDTLGRHVKPNAHGRTLLTCNFFGPLADREGHSPLGCLAAVYKGSLNSYFPKAMHFVYCPHLPFVTAHAFNFSDLAGCGITSDDAKKYLGMWLKE